MRKASKEIRGDIIIYISGLMTGIMLGYVLRKSRICFTGLVRDIYLQKDRYNALLFFAIICVQGLVYYLLATAGLIRVPSYLPPFSLLTIAVGSFAFGFGAVMSNGCLTATLVKCGDGRVSGWIYLAVFMASGYFFAAGHGIGLSKSARSVALADDNLSVRVTTTPAVIFGVLTIAIAAVMFRYSRKNSFKSAVKPKYTGIRHIVFEREWPRELGPVLTGVVLGLAFLASEPFGRHFGVAISTPIMSWIYMLTHPVETCGGCNPYDETFGWGSMLVLGIIIGSFITAAAGGEFKIIMPRREELIRGIIGAALMGFGAMWGLGCLLGNGLVGTAQLSVKSWYALIFLIAGIWTSTRIFFAPLLRE